MKTSTEPRNTAAKRSFYKWHRIIGLTALVPVIFWTISGLSHPFMSNWFRPYIPVEVYAQPTQNQLKPALSIQQVLDQNHITELRNFSLVSFNKNTYYQVIDKDSVYNYYSANNCRLLPDGDKLYAIYLARYFTQDSTSAIKSAMLQKAFDGQYQPINHLLPVWKIALNRPDGMDVYIETAQSRMGTFNNNTRKTFLWVFEQFHTWQFLADLGGNTFRLIVLLTLVSIMFLALLSGLIVYGLFWKNFKAVTDKRKQKGIEDKRFIHRYHRQIGLGISFILLLFIISGAFHLVVQLRYQKDKPQYAQLIYRNQLGLSNLQLPLADSNIKRVALARFNNHTFYQVTNNKKQILYFDAVNGTELQDGDKQYAAFLGKYYGDDKTIGDPTITRIGQFDNEYGFINKRLPVQRLSYADGRNRYIETTSAKLAAEVAGIDRAEGLSFIFLHKFFWMTWAGKDIRDIVSMLAALTVLIVSLLGFTAFIKNK
ncbi:PepSY domain-containing protein [Mucilaginibacter corticis]|uniref:PepSY domain-containing protein n=1 Tax=Mucilaginibacter corticis TaxID=2597670 RepID=A0A556MFX9_9SPHI|nr:PepSY-associated TM helix domain-containing protein [Mucilaginibacter corticis]TSJ38749.1 PepSY domain-containing protein [Mucilaginibacter corticis]